MSIVEELTRTCEMYRLEVEQLKKDLEAACDPKLLEFKTREAITEAKVQGGAAVILATLFESVFETAGGINYVEVDLHHKRLGGLIMTIQRMQGKTPHQFRVEAEAKVEDLKEAIRWTAQTVHQAHHADQDGTFNECPKLVCQHAKEKLEA